MITHIITTVWQKTFKLKYQFFNHLNCVSILNHIMAMITLVAQTVGLMRKYLFYTTTFHNEIHCVS